VWNARQQRYKEIRRGRGKYIALDNINSSYKTRIVLIFCVIFLLFKDIERELREE